VPGTDSCGTAAPEAPPFGMGIEAFGIDLASRFATEHPGLRVKFKPRVKSPAPAGLFFTFRAASLMLRSSPSPPGAMMVRSRGVTHKLGGHQRDLGHDVGDADIR
jgi:hypothetical protein